MLRGKSNNDKEIYCCNGDDIISVILSLAYNITNIGSVMKECLNTNTQILVYTRSLTS